MIHKIYNYNAITNSLGSSDRAQVKTASLRLLILHVRAGQPNYEFRR